MKTWLWHKTHIFLYRVSYILMASAGDSILMTSNLMKNSKNDGANLSGEIQGNRVGRQTFVKNDFEQLLEMRSNSIRSQAQTTECRKDRGINKKVHYLCRDPPLEFHIYSLIRQILLLLCHMEDLETMIKRHHLIDWQSYCLLG